MENQNIQIIQDRGKFVAINSKDGCINGSLLSDQLNIFLFKTLKQGDFQESSLHIQTLTGQKEMCLIDHSEEMKKGLEKPEHSDWSFLTLF